MLKMPLEALIMRRLDTASAGSLWSGQGEKEDAIGRAQEAWETQGQQKHYLS